MAIFIGGTQYSQDTFFVNCDCSLFQSEWNSSNVLVKSIQGITSDCTVIVSLAPSSIAAGHGKYGIYCSAQSNGTLTFGCAKKPDADVLLQVTAIFQK